MRQSQLFTKTSKTISQEEVSVNAQLLLRGGFIDKLFAGVYTMLPLGFRVLTKIETIIREEMNRVGGQEVLMPALNPKENWVVTGRWDTFDVLFKLTGSGDKEYALGASHEEVVTPLVQKFVFSYKDLPQAVYQMQTKFRNEARAKSGILRGREFRMKDLYSFHHNQQNLDEYYERMIEAYFRVYTRCGIREKTYLTFASGGTFSKYSHEYQTITEAGEDSIYICDTCNIAFNSEIIEDVNHACNQCQNKELREAKAIEVGNIFKLGTKYSAPFGFSYSDENNNQQPVIMGCYGIGSSRVMGTVVEIHHDEKGILWPEEIAPYSLHLVSLCQEPDHIQQAEVLYEQLVAKGIDVLFDDRPDVRAGEKFADSDLLGIPTRVVVSAKTLAQQSVEIKKRSSEDSDFKSIISFLAEV